MSSIVRDFKKITSICHGNIQAVYAIGMFLGHYIGNIGANINLESVFIFSLLSHNFISFF